MSAPTDHPEGSTDIEGPPDADRLALSRVREVGPRGGGEAEGPRGRQSGGEGHARRGPANIVLVGLSGSGKTTVGRLLAKRLGWRFIDTDREIQRVHGQSVQSIFRDHGEPRFREIEADMIVEVCGRTHQVIATGGGSPVAEANRARMLDGNLVIFLEGSPAVLATRLTRSIAREPRPVLGDSNLEERLAALAEQRDLAYRCAHHVVQTDHRMPREVADVIADLVRARA
jgi:shikimate kinase